MVKFQNMNVGSGGDGDDGGGEGSGEVGGEGNAEGGGKVEQLILSCLVVWISNQTVRHW